LSLSYSTAISCGNSVVGLGKSTRVFPTLPYKTPSSAAPRNAAWRGRSSFRAPSWTPVGSERRDPRHPPATIPTVRSLKLPDRQTSPRTIGKHTSGCCPTERDRVIVTAMDVATGSVVSGTDKCPAYALRNPNTPMEAPPPAPTIGAADLIDGGRLSVSFSHTHTHQYTHIHSHAHASSLSHASA